MSSNSSNNMSLTTSTNLNFLNINFKKVDLINLIQTLSCEIKILKKEVNILKLYLGTLLNKTL
jgi:hypothetical protein